MLVSMQPSALEAPEAPSRDFAGFLARFAGGDKTVRPQSEPDEGDEDVASLTYEHALRSHSCSSRVSAPDQPERNSGANSLTPGIHRLATTRSELPDAAMPHETNPPPQSGRRCSSITVRLSAAESEQLRLRAAEAGMTASAYLRSCAFEVESLRAEVKTTLSQLRSLNATKAEPIQSGKRRSWFRFIKLPNRARLQP